MPCQSLSDTFRVSFALKLNEDHLAKAPLLHTFAIWNLDKITQTLGWLRFQIFIFWFFCDLFTQIKKICSFWPLWNWPHVCEGNNFCIFPSKEGPIIFVHYPLSQLQKWLNPALKANPILLLLSLWEKFQFEGLRSDHFGALVATKNKNHCNALILKTFLDS